MKKRKFDPELDLLSNPKSFRPLSVFLFLLSVLIVFSAIEYIIAPLPEGGKLAIHWGIDGKPNGWQSVESFKIFARFFTLGILAFIWLVLGATCRFPSLSNPYRGRLLYRFPWLKRAKVWCIKHISVLDALVVNNILLGAFFVLIIFIIADTALSGREDLPVTLTMGFVAATIIPDVLFFFLWEPMKAQKV